ncbi:glycosyltransferase family 4 protein [Candidatus Saccharibacteria bacterium]|nr:glycosyltransferase family 4 protein [Candidatus Saccharibacteria bacterium]MBR6122250.1 glycosyltransferase family 4 protein [Candidatus Saccharibacteria bacterium]
MKALIVLENHFTKDITGNIWCDRVVDYNYLQRYLKVFDEIILAGRTQIVRKIKDKKLLVSGEHIKFAPMPDFKGAKGLLINLLKLKRIIREQTRKVDCVIYRAPTHLSLFTYKEVLRQKKPLALEFMMASDKMFDGDGVVKDMLNKIIDKKAKKMCLKADGVSYVTEHILQERYPCQATLNPHNKKYFTSSYSSIDLEEKMYHQQNWSKNSKPKCFHIIHTGYMDSYRKGQDVLIKAARIVSEKGYNIDVTFIGDGEKRAEFKELAEKCNIENIVHFKGLIKDKPTILKELRKSHLFVFPTQSEGLPRTVIEAMSQGLVCISSPVDGIPELLDANFLINYADAKGYADKIIELINDWDKCCLVSTANYEKSLKYASKFLTSKRTSFYQKLYNLAEAK